MGNQGVHPLTLNPNPNPNPNPNSSPNPYPNQGVHPPPRARSHLLTLVLGFLPTPRCHPAWRPGGAKRTGRKGHISTRFFAIRVIRAILPISRTNSPCSLKSCSRMCSLPSLNNLVDAEECAILSIVLSRVAQIGFGHAFATCVCFCVSSFVCWAVFSHSSVCYSTCFSS